MCRRKKTAYIHQRGRYKYANCGNGIPLPHVSHRRHGAPKNYYGRNTWSIHVGRHGRWYSTHEAGRGNYKASDKARSKAILEVRDERNRDNGPFCGSGKSPIWHAPDRTPVLVKFDVKPKGVGVKKILTIGAWQTRQSTKKNDSRMASGQPKDIP